MAKGGLAGIRRDDLDAGRAQHLFHGEEIARIVVDHEDLCDDRTGRSAGRARAWEARIRLCWVQMIHHDLNSCAEAPLGMAFPSET
jgi:hypothetical protein